jgi:hypothetical protein
VVTSADGTSRIPAPPSLPEDFRGVGRYVVPTLDVEVPFTWNANGGDMQMIAGSEQHPVHFTNVIADGTLYTLTYAFPGIPRNPCSTVGPASLADLNGHLSRAHFVGTMTLEGAVPRRVHHWRASGAWEPPAGLIPPIAGLPVLRLPVMAGDIYVDADDATVWRRLLHFGIQNAYAADLDEWIILDEFEHAPGDVDLPAECTVPGS